MNGMFEGNYSANPNVSNWNTSKVTNMGKIFKYAVIAQPDVSGWDVSQVTNMAEMFRSAQTDVDMSSWVLTNVTDMTDMFFANNALTDTSYSTLLIRLDATNANPGVSLHGGAAQYTSGAATTARGNLVGNGWVITDGGAAP